MTPTFLTSATDGGKRQLQALATDSNPHSIRGWVGPRAGLDVLVQSHNLLSLPGIKPRFLGRPTRRSVTTPTKLSRLLCKRTP